jgi:nicotinate-nucleotide adenylyltransferase
MFNNKLGVFGGTFNPIHIAHLRLAEDVREEYDLGSIIFIPTNTPPHKNISSYIDPQHRLRMTELAIDDVEYFTCDDVEIKRGGTSYTIYTVEYLYENFEFEEKPYFIIGSDLASEIHTWKDIELLLQKVYFIILVRDGYPIVENKFFPKSSLHKNWDFYERRKIDITSSEIRMRVREQRSIRYLVPDKVLEYIKEKRLYIDG